MCLMKTTVIIKQSPYLFLLLVDWILINELSMESSLQCVYRVFRAHKEVSHICIGTLRPRGKLLRKRSIKRLFYTLVHRRLHIPPNITGLWLWSWVSFNFPFHYCCCCCYIAAVFCHLLVLRISIRTLHCNSSVFPLSYIIIYIIFQSNHVIIKFIVGHTALSY